MNRRSKALSKDGTVVLEVIYSPGWQEWEVLWYQGGQVYPEHSFQSEIKQDVFDHLRSLENHAIAEGYRVITIY